jgi:ribosomal protein L11 methyltransferase
MLDLFPEGFEEAGAEESLELLAFTDAAGEARARAAFDEVSAEPVADGWEEGWKRFHRAVRIRSLWVGPPWEAAPPDATEVVIDPGRAFGTGAHPTTQLCLELLHDLEHDSLLDVGCGSGVVSIAACKLGFAPVTAVDLDEAAVEAARRNALANRVEVDVELLDARTEALPEARIAVANIDLATLAALSIPGFCAIVVASGYYAGDAPQLPGFEAIARRVRDGWAADLFTRE